MREAAGRLEAGDTLTASEIVRNALGYAGLLREHIQEGDRVLFPMADEMIPVAQHASITQGFEHVEHEETGEGVHEKYLALAEALELEVQV